MRGEKGSDSRSLFPAQLTPVPLFLVASGDVSASGTSEKQVNALTEQGARRLAFVSTRIAGTDGVSLEIAKWADVLERMGIECCYIAGESDRPDDCTFLSYEVLEEELRLMIQRPHNIYRFVGRHKSARR
jgi:hypothetical protein